MVTETKCGVDPMYEENKRVFGVSMTVHQRINSSGL